MAHIFVETRIDAPKENVWNVIADFGGVVKYNPNIKDSYSTSENSGGIGATRHCDLLPMGWVEERIFDWAEGDSYSLEIFDGKRIAPFKFARARIQLSASGDQTDANMKFEYRLKYGVFGAVMDRLVVSSQFRKAIESLMDGLKYYAETGQRATRQALAQASVAA